MSVTGIFMDMITSLSRKQLWEILFVDLLSRLTKELTNKIKTVLECCQDLRPWSSDHKTWLLMVQKRSHQPFITCSGCLLEVLYQRTLIYNYQDVEGCWHFRHKLKVFHPCLPFHFPAPWMHIVSFTHYYSSHWGAGYCDESVCLWVCVFANLSQEAHIRTHQILYACCLWMWLSPPPVALWYFVYFWFCGWCQVFYNGSYGGTMLLRQPCWSVVSQMTLLHAVGYFLSKTSEFFVQGVLEQTMQCTTPLGVFKLLWVYSNTHGCIVWSVCSHLQKFRHQFHQ